MRFSFCMIIFILLKYLPCSTSSTPINRACVRIWLFQPEWCCTNQHERSLSRSKQYVMLFLVMIWFVLMNVLECFGMICSSLFALERSSEGQISKKEEEDMSIRPTIMHPIAHMDVKRSSMDSINLFNENSRRLAEEGMDLCLMLIP